MIFEEMHSRIYTIATTVTDEDTFIKVIPRTKKKSNMFGNIPKNTTSLVNEAIITNNNAIQLSLFN